MSTQDGFVLVMTFATRANTVPLEMLEDIKDLTKRRKTKEEVQTIQ